MRDGGAVPATVGVVACTFALTAAGAYAGAIARGAEVFLVLALPLAHAFTVSQANALCGRWNTAA